MTHDMKPRCLDNPSYVDDNIADCTATCSADAALHRASVLGWGAWCAQAGKLWFQAFINTLFPRYCAGCSAADVVLCERCFTSYWHRESARILTGVSNVSRDARACGSQPQISRLLVYSCSQYAGPVRSSILSWKDHGDEECTVYFARRLVAMMPLVIEDCAARWYADGSDDRRICGQAQASGIDAATGYSVCLACSVVPARACSRPIVLIPVPSSTRSSRRRGRWHMLQLVRTCATMLRARGYDVSVAPVLSLAHVRYKSVQRSDRQSRLTRLDGRIRIKPHDREVFDHAWVLLLDDIVTSGATLTQCAQALASVGIPVHATLTLASA